MLTIVAATTANGLRDNDPLAHLQVGDLLTYLNNLSHKFVPVAAFLLPVYASPCYSLHMPVRSIVQLTVYASQDDIRTADDGNRIAHFMPSQEFWQNL